MTLPLTTTLPLRSEQIETGGKELASYLNELIDHLEDQYEQVAYAVNGDIRQDVDTGSRQFLPTISGSTIAGVGTYTRQIGIVLRQGIMVDVWFDVAWTAHTGTGNLILNLPYLVAINAGNPFVGVCNTVTIGFTGFVTCSAVPNTRQLQFIDSRTGAAAVTIGIIAAATVRGHIRYVGQQYERT